MKTNDFKNIWQSGTEENIKPYSNNELNEMIVKSARKSMKRMYPSGIFMLVIAAVVVLLVVNITVRYTAPSMRLLDLGALLIIAVSLTLWFQSFFTMNKYKTDMSIKNWLEYRIKEVEKTLKFYSRYNILICIISLFAALGYYYLFTCLDSISYNPWLIAGMTVGLVACILFSQKYSIKRYKKTLYELQDLYNQLEE